MNKTTTTPNDSLAAMMAQYEKNNTPTYTKKENVVAYDDKHYFGTYLDDKERTKTKTVRILPTTDGSSPMVEMHGHKIQVEGKWRTFACLQSEQESACPFCEARSALLAEGKETDKELAKKYSSKKMYIVKVIDRDNELDGVKFWRFNHDYRGTGVYDKIFGVLKVARDITSQATGRDLQISINRDQKNNPTVASIIHCDSTPLNTDSVIAEEWINDTKVWKDVFPVKSYDYLEIIVKGGVPVWDKDEKKFVDKSVSEKLTEVEKLDSELTMGLASVVKGNVKVAEQPLSSSNDTDTETIDEIDDLPF